MRRTLLGICVFLLPAGALADEYRVSPYIVTPDDQFVTKGGSGLVSRILYVNDCKPDGCFIRVGSFNDARENISTVPKKDSVITPFSHDQSVWDATIECLRQVYGPYDVEIVTTDPGTELHHEAILAGSAMDVEQPADVGGIAPFSCTAQNNVISFSFANQAEPDWVDLCWTVAQESAHAFGLDHAFECLDPMTYIPNCGQKFFRNDFLSCGEFQARSCQCGGLVQNSHRMLLNVFGPGTPAPPPLVVIDYPADGATVVNGFVVQATASDPRLVDRLELRINGWLYETREGKGYFDTNRDEYQFNVPLDLADGIMDIEVMAYNDVGSVATATATVTKGEPCVAADACLDGQECQDGRCVWPPPTGQLGDVCERTTDCVSLLCPQNGTERLCSEYCTPGAANACPAGYECLAAQDTGVCWPAANQGGGGGGGCSASSSTTPAAGAIALFLLAGALIRRRRRTA